MIYIECVCEREIEGDRGVPLGMVIYDVLNGMTELLIDESELRLC